MSTPAVVHIYDRLDVSLLMSTKDPQARWIAEQMEKYPDDQILLCVTTPKCTVYLGATSFEDAVQVLAEAREEMQVSGIDLRGREDAVASLRAALGEGS